MSRMFAKHDLVVSSQIANIAAVLRDQEIRKPGFGPHLIDIAEFGEGGENEITPLQGRMVLTRRSCARIFVPVRRFLGVRQKGFPVTLERFECARTCLVGDLPGNVGLAALVRGGPHEKLEQLPR